MNYLFVGAHPDDIEISAMGLLIKLLEKKHQVCMVISSLPKDTYNIRKEEQNKVNSFLASKFANFVNLGFLEFQDSKLYYDTLEIKDELEKIISSYKIDIVVTHFGKDTHLDHESVSKAADIAGRKISVINFESPNNYEFIPNFFVPLTQEEIDMKIKLMTFHESQNIKNNNFYLDKIKANGIFRGQAVYEPYAEAFFIKRLKSTGLGI